MAFLLPHSPPPAANGKSFTRTANCSSWLTQLCSFAKSDDKGDISTDWLDLLKE